MDVGAARLRRVLLRRRFHAARVAPRSGVAAGVGAARRATGAGRELVVRAGRGRRRNPGLPQLRPRGCRHRPAFRRADHDGDPQGRQHGPARPGLLGRGLGRDPGIPVDLVRHRQSGAWAQGGLFLRHRSRRPIRPAARRERPVAGKPVRHQAAALRVEPSGGGLRPSHRRQAVLQRQAGGVQGRHRASDLRAGGGRLGRAQPHAARPQPRGQDRRAGGVLLQRHHRRVARARRRRRPRPTSRRRLRGPRRPAPLRWRRRSCRPGPRGRAASAPTTRA